MARPAWLRCASLTAKQLVAPPAFGATGYVHVLDAISSGEQKIYGLWWYDLTAGTLTALPGFPVATGGTGSASSFVSCMAIDRTNSRLYALNTLSSNVSAYTINTGTGALTAMPFSPLAVAGASSLIGVGIHPSGSPLILTDANNGFLNSYNITASTAMRARRRAQPKSRKDCFGP